MTPQVVVKSLQKEETIWEDESESISAEVSFEHEYDKIPIIMTERRRVRYQPKSDRRIVKDRCRVSNRNKFQETLEKVDRLTELNWHSVEPYTPRFFKILELSLKHFFRASNFRNWNYLQSNIDVKTSNLDSALSSSESELPSDHIYVLTPEGTKRFFDILEEPNPESEKAREMGKRLISKEQTEKFGKEKVTLVLKSAEDK